MKLSKSCTVISDLVSKKKKKISDLEDITILIVQTCFCQKFMFWLKFEWIGCNLLPQLRGLLARKDWTTNNYNKTNANRINSLEVEETCINEIFFLRLLKKLCNDCSLIINKWICRELNLGAGTTYLLL